MVVALTVAAVVFGVTVLVTGSDQGLGTVEPDARAVPLPGNRPLLETDVGQVRFDTAVRGYRMGQVDQALRRTAYDIGYKDELIGVLQAEVTALREGRLPDAEALRRAREAALAPAGVSAGSPATGTRALGADPEPVDDGATGGSRRGEPSASSSAPSSFATTDTAVVAGSAPAAPGPLEFDRVGDEQADEDGDPAAATRPVRAGGSVIEAEDGELAAPTRVVRPDAGAAGSETAATGEATEAGAEAEDDTATVLTRPKQASGATGRTGATAEDGTGNEDAPTKPVRRPAQASGPAEPTGPPEQSERK